MPARPRRGQLTRISALSQNVFERVQVLARPLAVGAAPFSLSVDPLQAIGDLRQFGSLRKLTAATVAEIAETPGFGQVTAEAVYAALHPDNGTGNGGPAAADDAPA